MHPAARSAWSGAARSGPRSRSGSRRRSRSLAGSSGGVALSQLGSGRRWRRGIYRWSHRLGWGHRLRRLGRWKHSRPGCSNLSRFRSWSLRLRRRREGNICHPRPAAIATAGGLEIPEERRTSRPLKQPLSSGNQKPYHQSVQDQW